MFGCKSQSEKPHVWGQRVGGEFVLHAACQEELAQERAAAEARWKRRCELAERQTGQVEGELKVLAEELSAERKSLHRLRAENKDKIERLEAEGGEAQREVEKHRGDAAQAREEAIQTRSKLKELEIELEMKDAEWRHERR